MKVPPTSMPATTLPAHVARFFSTMHRNPKCRTYACATVWKAVSHRNLDAKIVCILINMQDKSSLDSAEADGVRRMSGAVTCRYGFAPRKGRCNATVSALRKDARRSRASRFRPMSMPRPWFRCSHYTDRLFSFRITRPQSFRFRSGEFVMIGLPNAEKPVFRAYSIASPNWDEEIEFFSIKVPDGPLTSELQKIEPGDTVLMRQKSTGTLVTRRADAGQAAVHDLDRHRHRALRQPDPRPRDLREVRPGHPDPHLPRPCRTGLWRRTGRRPGRRPADRRTDRAAASRSIRRRRARSRPAWAASRG